MGLSLAKLERAVNGVVPNYASVKIVPRSVPLFVDKILRGDVRFAKKTGNNIALIAPDIKATLTSDVRVRQSIFEVSSLQRWFVPGSFVSFGPDFEFGTIRDVNYDENVIILESPVVANHAAGSQLILYAVPILSKSHVVPSATSNIIVVEGDYFMGIGDQLLIELTPGLSGSLVAYDVVSATYDQSSSSYILVLNKPINREVVIGGAVYLRTFPAYASNPVTIPTGDTSTRRDGPFLIDYLSGRTAEGKSVAEYLSVQVYSQLGNTIYGTATTPSLIGKNTIIPYSPVRADVLLFWNKVEGSLQYYSTGQVALLPGSRGKFTFTQDMVPVLPKCEWTLPVTTNKDIAFSVRFTSTDLPDCVFANTNLIAYTYNSATGLVQYANNVDLTSVQRGYTFIDSVNREYCIFDVDIANNRIFLGTNLPVSGLAPVRQAHGSIFLGNARRTYDIAAGDTLEVLIGANGFEADATRVEFSYTPAQTFRNNALVSFTYDRTTGIIQYASPVDLSNVAVDQKFIDSDGTEFDIIAVDDTNDRLTIAIDQIVAVAVPTQPEHGAVVINYDGVEVKVGDWNLTYTQLFKFRNLSLVTYTYDVLTSSIQFTSDVDLSGVAIGDVFLDSANSEFLISAVDDITNKLTLVIPPGSVVTTDAPKDFTDGAVIMSYINEVAFSLAYILVSRAEDNWFSTGLIVKNMFLSFADIKARYDTYRIYDGGTVYS